MKTKSERGHGLPRTSRKRLSEGTRDEQITRTRSVKFWYSPKLPPPRRGLAR
jgi:hypothetical protein